MRRFRKVPPMTNQSDWDEWFRRWGDYGVHAAYYECNADFTVEDLYQMFKARLEAERQPDEPKASGQLLPCPHCGSLNLCTVEDGQEHWTVQCADCLACGPRRSNVEGVAKLDWNERNGNQ